MKTLIGAAKSCLQLGEVSQESSNDARLPG
jgi:hypothetical protein